VSYLDKAQRVAVKEPLESEESVYLVIPISSFFVYFVKEYPHELPG
jgi:hypothetical protein